MAARKARKKPKPKPGLERPFNDNQWTWNQFRTFVTKALRGARWAPRYLCIRKQYVADGINPKTGRKCKLHRCALCDGLFPQNKMKADHIVPVVGPEGFVDWNTYVERLFVDTSGFQAICDGCHKVKTKEENEERKRLKDESKASADAAQG